MNGLTLREKLFLLEAQKDLTPAEQKELKELQEIWKELKTLEKKWSERNKKKLIDVANEFYELAKLAKTRVDAENIVLPDSLDTLAKYVNAGYYIRFGDSRTKIGLNPSYLGPNIHGIYSFYLDEDIFNSIASSTNRTFFSRRFIQIIKFTGNKLLDSRAYTQQQLKSDLKLLEASVPDKQTKELIKKYEKLSVNPAKIIMKVIREVLAPTSIAGQTKILLTLGYQAVQDHGDGILFGSDKPPGQTVFLSRQFVDIVDIINNPNYQVPSMVV